MPKGFAQCPGCLLNDNPKHSLAYASGYLFYRRSTLSLWLCRAGSSVRGLFVSSVRGLFVSSMFRCGLVTIVFPLCSGPSMVD